MSVGCSPSATVPAPLDCHTGVSGRVAPMVCVSRLSSCAPSAWKEGLWDSVTADMYDDEAGCFLPVALMRWLLPTVSRPMPLNAYGAVGWPGQSGAICATENVSRAL